LGTRGSYEFNTMMAYNLRASVWPRVIFQIQKGFSSIFEVFPGIKAYPEGKMTYPLVYELFLKPWDITSDRMISHWVLRHGLGSLGAYLGLLGWPRVSEFPSSLVLGLLLG
ncbi:hypothetical protein PanWU01x14_211700, partial [Parasponia andersonii]